MQEIKCSCCANAAIAGRSLCVRCVKTRHDRYVSDRDFRKAMGICAHAGCESVRANGKSLCAAHLQKYNEYSKRNAKKLRSAVIQQYGGECECCGERRVEFLTMDHVGGNGVGAEHRKQEGGTMAVYRRLYELPVDKTKFRVLCMNCNAAHSWYGYCPHELEVKQTEKVEN